MYVYLLSMYRMYIVLMEILMELCERACEIIKMFSFYVITEQVMKLTKGNKKNLATIPILRQQILLYYYKNSIFNICF